MARPFLTGWRRLFGLFRRAPKPADPHPFLHGMELTSGPDELARRERLQRISGAAPRRGWMDRSERPAERVDLNGF